MKYQKPALPTVQEIPQIFLVLVVLSMIVFTGYTCVDHGINGWKDDLISGQFANIDRVVANQAPLESISDPKTREMAQLFGQSYLQDDFRTLPQYQKQIAASCDGGEMCNSTNEACVNIWSCSKESLEYYDHMQLSVARQYKHHSREFDAYVALYQTPPQRNTKIKYYVGVCTFAAFSLLLIFSLIFELVKSKSREKKFKRVERTLTRVREHKLHYRISAIDDVSPESLRRVVDLKMLEAEEEAEALEVAAMLEQQVQAKSRA